jgi:uncharacterized membrane protein YozB (DUF420 family)
VIGTDRSSTDNLQRGVAGGGTATLTRALLACGALAGPFYLVVGLAQAFTRPGFDITRHDLSVLSNGTLGWIQIANFLITGALVVAGAAGMRRALRSGRARTWGPLLIAVYGAALIGAGFFIADPVAGFPPGTPASAVVITWHGLLHLLCAAVGFLALIVACVLFARRFAALGERAWAAFSAVAGAAFLAGFLALVFVQGDTPGTSGGAAILGFWIALALVWCWLSALSVRLMVEA